MGTLSIRGRQSSGVFKDVLVNSDGSVVTSGGAAAAAAADAGANPTTSGEIAYLMVYDRAASQWNRASAGRDVGSGALTQAQVIATAPAVYDTTFATFVGTRTLGRDGEDSRTIPGFQMGLFNPQQAASPNQIVRARTPSTWKSFGVTAITAGAGATIWTPGGGLKFRIMGFSLSTSVAGQIILSDNIAATVLMRSATLPAGGIWELGAADLGNGILSAAANNVLKIDGPTGNVAGMVWGTEE